jgi:predicted helicase
MTLEQYIDNINKRHTLGNATEHTFRGDLQQLIESLVPAIRATNEPKRQSCGAPDYILTKKDIPVGFIEAKDLGDKDLEGAKKTGNKEQFDRYKASLNNLIFTDYLDFHLYRDGQFVMKISIGEITPKGIKPLPENFAAFDRFINDFCTHIGQTIKSSKRLAEMMAGKARLLSDVIEKALTSDETNHEDSTLKDQMKAFKEILIHDITPKGFADVYAQTITYGMFAARLHDPTLPTFSRQEAFELIPKSNPFLKKLFGYIAGLELDERIKWIVDDLVTIFLACNVEDMLKNYGKSTKMEDPIIHFYEDFLSEYDPKLRKARGVWYTPQPVVNFIVRAVDDILKTEFGLPQGLADTSKTKINTEVQGKKVEKEVHKVQILDPATGTGTFLAEVVKHIHKKFEGQQGIWSNYVETHLLPRLNGFELLMASYAMAHLKLDLLLKETGYQPTTQQRLRVYLTNSLEEHHQDTGTLFANWLSTEANEANHIKRDTPVMCVIGNPPYSIVSSNLSVTQRLLVEKYKFVNGIKIKEKGALQFEKIINDDYIKFISLAENFVLKSGEGIVAYINNNNFLDSPELRGLRYNLAATFDSIFIIDLHGSSKKKEKAPDGSPDINVFSIQQGVSINIFVKTGKKKKGDLAKVFYSDAWGNKESKFNYLNLNSIKNIEFIPVELKSENYLFIPRDNSLANEFDKLIKIKSLFLKDSTGIISARDNMVIDFNKNSIIKRIELFAFSEMEDAELCRELKISLKKGWDIKKAREKLKSNNNIESLMSKISYRPFDNRHIFYDDTLVWTTARPIMKNFLNNDNYGLLIGKKGQVVGSMPWNLSFITKNLADFNLFYRGGINLFPLYLNQDNFKSNNIFNKITERTPNLNPEIVKQIADKLGLPFVPEKRPSAGSVLPTEFAPIDLLDYIYAVLHSPTYREKYKEFLKIDFPRVPYPKDQETFWKLVQLGGEIRQMHLLESPVVERYITQYPMNGDNVVVKPRFVAAQPADKIGRVYINHTQYFDNVPQIAWEFYIGGYQPAQKWLKDRKDRKLEFEDILHYQKIIVALSETDRLMKEIDNVDFV